MTRDPDDRVPPVGIVTVHDPDGRERRLYPITYGRQPFHAVLVVRIGGGAVTLAIQAVSTPARAEP